MKKKFLLVLVLVLAVMVTACGDGASQSTSPSEAPTPDNTSAVATQPPADIRPVISAEPIACIFAIGQTVMLGEWEITLDSFDVVPEIAASYGSFQPDGGNVYVVTSLTIKNLAKEAATFLPMVSMSDDIRAKVLYQGEDEYSSTSLLGHDTDLHDRNLNPLSSTEGIIAFEIVEDVATSGDLTLNLSNGVESITFDLSNNRG